jgi:autotransporter-associated beta strand protein
MAYGSGSALVVEESSAITIPNAVNFTNTTAGYANSLNIVGNPAGVTFSGPWSLSVAASIGSGNVAGNLVIISGLVSGAAGITKFNPGTLELTAANIYSGATTISAGTLTIGGSGSLGSGNYAATIANSGTFNYNSSAAQTLSGLISGTGSLGLNGAGTLTLSAANSYSGGTTVSAGTLQVGVDSAIPAGSSVIMANGRDSVRHF